MFFYKLKLHSKMTSIIQTLPYSVFNESEKINSLFEAGMDFLHIRKPLYTESQMKLLIEGIEKKYHSKITIHSHFSLLKKFELKGIHISSSDLNSFFKKRYIKYLKGKYNISVSITVSNLKSKNITDNLIDYGFVGPVFINYSEESIVSNYNLFEAKKELKALNKKVYAQGIYSLQNISAINAAGFSGPVLQSYIWKSDDILNNFKSLILNSEERVEKDLKSIAI